MVRDHNVSRLEEPTKIFSRLFLSREWLSISSAPCGRLQFSMGKGPLQLDSIDHQEKRDRRRILFCDRFLYARIELEFELFTTVTGKTQKNAAIAVFHDGKNSVFETHHWSALSPVTAFKSIKMFDDKVLRLLFAKLFGF